jgi:hypothetical protein
MKYIFVALGLLCSVAHAQLSEYERKFACGKTQFVISVLTRTAQEKPIWVGADPETNTQTMILQNTQTLTWTVVQYDQTMACVLHSGEGFQVLSQAFQESH